MELALPITIYWDLACDTPVDASLLRFCDEIIECRPLMLQLYDPSPVPGDGLRAILEKFSGTLVAVTLTVPYSSLTSFPVNTPDDVGVKELLLACDDPESVQETFNLPISGLSFSVNSGNWRKLPALLSLMRNRGVKRLVLPMQRLYMAEDPFQLNRDQQEILADSLAAIGGADGLRLTIHDPFLWRVFNPGIPFPQGGCQAANTMIAISPDGGVYPCPTFPERIGELGAAALKEIIASPVKRELRGKILRYPAACDGCPEVAICRGGCRGRSYVKKGSYDCIDDACR